MLIDGLTVLQIYILFVGVTKRMEDERYQLTPPDIWGLVNPMRYNWPIHDEHGFGGLVNKGWLSHRGEGQYQLTPDGLNKLRGCFHVFTERLDSYNGV